MRISHVLFKVHNLPLIKDFLETDQVLNVRVKERETETNRPKSRLGSQIRSGLEKGTFINAFKGSKRNPNG